MRPNQKLYVVTRADLPPGQQAVQGMHALVEFCLEYPTLIKNWHEQSNHLCFLSVANEEELKNLRDRTFEAYVLFEEFFEPDLEDSLTALVIDATDETSELVKDLKLALR